MASDEDFDINTCETEEKRIETKQKKPEQEDKEKIKNQSEEYQEYRKVLEKKSQETKETIQKENLDYGHTCDLVARTSRKWEIQSRFRLQPGLCLKVPGVAGTCIGHLQELECSPADWYAPI
uniref:Uncharacterized protein n=1 Tax=Timema genevievae TaxID=629358 RepID=A0A7R9PLA4_TIMGE|nr:unnamed protein product [Timema genevievae]